MSRGGIRIEEPEPDHAAVFRRESAVFWRRCRLAEVRPGDVLLVALGTMNGMGGPYRVETWPEFDPAARLWSAETTPMDPSASPGWLVLRGGP